MRHYNQRFGIFKELSINKVNKLDQELKIAKEKERNLNIKIIGEQDKEKIENYKNIEEYNSMKRRISQYEIDMKKNEDLIKKCQSDNFKLKKKKKKLKIAKKINKKQNNKTKKKNKKK